MTDASGKSVNLGVVSGKRPEIYVFDRTNLGKFNGASTKVVKPSLFGSTFGVPAYFNQALYYGTVSHTLKKLTFSHATLSGTFAARTPTTFKFPGTTPSISASQSNVAAPSNGIVWCIEMGSSTAAPTLGLDGAVTTPTGATQLVVAVVGPPILHAYDATNLLELYNSTQNPTNLGVGIKFSVPTVCNSKVYVGTANEVSAFGFLTPTAHRAAPVTLPASVSLTPGPIQKDPLSNHFLQTVTLTNHGTTGFAPPLPLSLVLDSLSVNARLDFNSGSTTLPPSGNPTGAIASPYMNFPLTSALAPGKNVSVGLTFIDPSDQVSQIGHITYTPRLLGGLGCR
jgi:hypothetical protein